MPTEFDLEKGFSIGDNMAIRIGGTIKYYVVTNRDNIFYQKEHDEIAADSTESYDEMTDLNPPHGQVYPIYKIWVDGNIKLYLKQPAAGMLQQELKVKDRIELPGGEVGDAEGGVSVAAAALAWAMFSSMSFAEWASPHRKIPSVAKSTGRSFRWAST